MPISSKRSGSQQTITRHQQQSVPQNNGYDDYVYYPYYTKTTPTHGYEYRQESRQYEQQPRQYYETRTTNSSNSAYRT
jgi:hypothetical protein